TNPQLLGGARRVVVMGGGAVGMETAFWLSYEKGCKVTVLDMLPYFMDGACTANRGHLIHYLEKNGVTLANCATIARFEDHDTVLVSRNISKGVPDPYCTWTPTLPKNIPNPLAPKIGPESYIETYLADLFV
ncbi:MAG TPA: enoate reductase, partial [Clostridiales bacterium]|nr:enoate reductase [Clostridiales bacterium]